VEARLRANADGSAGNVPARTPASFGITDT
jgi:hypothetical protein